MAPALDIALDREADVPLGVQLAWALRARILSGELEGGRRLPGVRELAAATGVNANTVRAVYVRLESEGLIAAQHGRGTFVSRDVRADDRLGEVARDALEAARTAGVDPRDVAAALYSGGMAPEVDEAAERRALRAQIDALERELADARLVRRMRPAVEEPPPARRGQGRLLSIEELRASRDDLAGRLRLLREADAQTEAAEAAAAPEQDTRAAERPRSASSSGSATGPVPVVRWTPSFGR